MTGPRPGRDALGGHEMKPVNTCLVCAHPVAGSAALVCSRCATPHHGDCWEFVGGCSVYGCGGTSPEPFVETEEELDAPVLVLDAATAERHPASIRNSPLLVHLRRQVRSLPATLGAGALGGLLGCVVAHPSLRYSGDTPEVLGLTVGCGLLHGLLAPFVAPLQLRRSMAFTVAALALSFGVFVISGSRNCAAAQIISLVLGCSLAASTLSERLFGRRSERGVRSPKLAMVFRYLSTGVFCFLGLILATILRDGGLFPAKWLLEMLPFVALSMVCAGHPLERGKALLSE
jgi:hypothetical protein